MEMVYEILYGCHVWKSGMEMLYGNLVWKSCVEIMYRNQWAKNVYGNRAWELCLQFPKVGEMICKTSGEPAGGYMGEPVSPDSFNALLRS